MQRFRTHLLRQISVVGVAITLMTVAGCAQTRGTDIALGTDVVENDLSPEDAALVAALLDLKERDQTARAAMIKLMQEADPLPGGGFQISNEQYGIMQAVHEIDAESTAFLKEMIAERGWPTISQVGEEGSGAAWLLVQHADAEPEFQSQVLELMAPLAKAGEVKGVHFAMLTDRVLLARGEQQVYATQFETGENGVMRPQATVDWDNIEARRAEVGLPTLEEYGQKMIETYGGTVELTPAEDG